MTGTRLLPAVALTAALTLAASACSGDSQPPPSTGSSSPSSAATSAAPGPTAAASALPSDPPSNSQGDSQGDLAGDEPAGDVETHEVSGGGVSFDVPGSFTAYDVQKVIAAGKGSPQLEKLAAALGVTVEQFNQVYAQMKLVVVNLRSAASGFGDNVNIVQLTSAMPTADQVRDQWEGVGFTVRDMRESSTEAGPARVVVYDGAVGGIEVMGTSILVDLGGSVAIITVSTDDAEVAATLAETIVRTLDRSSVTS